MTHRHRPPRGAFFFATLALLGSLVTAHAATLLPNGKQTFIDANGAPLALGTVQFYAPGTTTPKNTWQDAAQTILNTNPITLDISGQAIIYGAGCYRQVVKDKNANTIWDQPTCDTSSSNPIWGGHSAGTANAQTITASNFTGVDGQTIVFIAGLTNTATTSFIVNGTAYNVLRDTATGAFSLSGGEVFAGNLIQATYDATRGSFHLITNPVVGSQPISVLSGSGTTDIGAANSRYVNITGSATITSFGSSASLSYPLYVIKFQGASVLVNSANLVLPGYTNLTTAAGDYATVAYAGGGVWQLTQYFSAAGPLPSQYQGITGEVRMFRLTACPTGWTAPTDLYGRFVRAFDPSGAVDPGRTVGSYQADSIIDHTHGGTGPLFSSNASAGAAAQAFNGSYGSQNTTGVNTPNGGGTETRPKNIALLFCQKS